MSTEKNQQNFSLILQNHGLLKKLKENGCPQALNNDKS